MPSFRIKINNLFPCQVGGSFGFVCILLATTFPNIHFVVQDLPEVVATGASKLPPALADRVNFMAHDFLTEQPVKNADIYFFRWIFHNWSDKYCIQILRNLIPALKPGAVILINDNCLPEPNTLTLWPEERIRCVYFLSFLPLSGSSSTQFRRKKKSNYEVNVWLCYQGLWNF